MKVKDDIELKEVSEAFEVLSVLKSELSNPPSFLSLFFLLFPLRSPLKPASSAVHCERRKPGNQEDGSISPGFSVLFYLLQKVASGEHLLPSTKYKNPRNGLIMKKWVSTQRINDEEPVRRRDCNGFLEIEKKIEKRFCYLGHLLPAAACYCLKMKWSGSWGMGVRVRVLDFFLKQKRVKFQLGDCGLNHYRLIQFSIFFPFFLFFFLFFLLT